MPKPISSIPPQLLQFYLPGLEIAANNLVEQMNQIQRAMGGAGDYRLSSGASPNGGGTTSQALIEAPPQLGGAPGRIFSDEARAKMSTAQKKRWAKDEFKAKTPEKLPTVAEAHPTATIAQLSAWAKRHKNFLDVAKFKTANPNVHCRAIGIMVRSKMLIRTAEVDVYAFDPTATAKKTLFKEKAKAAPAE